MIAVIGAQVADAVDMLASMRDARRNSGRSRSDKLADAFAKDQVLMTSDSFFFKSLN